MGLHASYITPGTGKMAFQHFDNPSAPQQQQLQRELPLGFCHTPENIVEDVQRRLSEIKSAFVTLLDLPEIDAHSTVATPLRRHQKQALFFMLHRESEDIDIEPENDSESNSRSNCSSSSSNNNNNSGNNSDVTTTASGRLSGCIESIRISDDEGSDGRDSDI
ncbi:hypothetical protein EV182_003283, partial [Spiromyces aspiralis]